MRKDDPMSKAPRLSLLPRDDFAGLDLHAKNAYLQELADTFADGQARDRVTLDKDALARQAVGKGVGEFL